MKVSTITLEAYQTSQISVQPTDTYLECEGATSLSQALGKNKALTKLSLAGEAKRNTIVIYAYPNQFSSVMNQQATELGLWERKHCVKH